MKSAPQPSERSALEIGLGQFFAAYGRHFLTGAPPLPAFTARLVGPIVELEVIAPDGPHTVRRRASAYLLLAGEFWGASRAAEERATLPALIPSLTPYPNGDIEWRSFFQFRTDPDVGVSLECLAEMLAPTARDEAILLLRRLFDIDRHYGPDRESSGAVLRTRRLPPDLRADVAARSPVTDVADWSREVSPHGAVKKLLPFVASTRETDRLAVAMRIADVLPRLLHSNHLTFFELVEEALAPLRKDDDGAVFEVALGVAQAFSAKLLFRAAYAESKTLLERVITHHVGLAETLRSRWECRLYLDDPGAEDDWSRAAALDAPTDPSYLGRCMFWRGDVRDRRSVALSRVAAALVSKADGTDPCKDRKPTKTTPSPSASERTKLLARAQALAAEAAGSAESRVNADLDDARARPGGAVPERGFQAEQYAARAKVREASGELAEALADLRKAREVRVAGGLSWQIDEFGPDIRRLTRQLANADQNAIPLSFEPDWLIDPKRTSKEREFAAARWEREPWRTFPKSPASAVGRPFAYVLLRNVVAHSETIWKVAAEDKIDLGDRIAFAMRALTMLDACAERRDASTLLGVLEDAHLVAFFGTSAALHAKPAKARRPLLSWVRSLVDAKLLDDGAVLRGLDGEPWANLGACFEDHVREYDVLRELFDAVRKAGFDGDAVAQVLAAYAELLTSDWSDVATPRAPWDKLAAPLASLDGARLAPALIAWTRAHQKIPEISGRPYLRAKWLWPLYYAWSRVHVAPFLAEVRKGGLDNGKSLSTTQRRTRRECLAWFDAKA